MSDLKKLIGAIGLLAIVVVGSVAVLTMTDTDGAVSTEKYYKYDVISGADTLSDSSGNVFRQELTEYITYNNEDAVKIYALIYNGTSSDLPGISVWITSVSSAVAGYSLFEKGTLNGSTGSTGMTLTATTSNAHMTLVNDGIGSTLTFYLGDLKGNKLSGSSEVTLNLTGQVISKYTYTTSIAYDANGGTGAPSKTTTAEKTSIGTVPSGTESITLSTTVPTWEHHTFRGWSENKASTGDGTKAGAKYSVSAGKDITMYALWDNETLYLTLKNDDTTFKTVAADYGTAAQIPTDVPTKDGYVFVGWSATKGASEAEYYAGGTVQLDSSKTLYAVWGQGIVTYTLSFDPDEGSGAPSTLTNRVAAAENSFIIPSDVPTRDGYDFVGWAGTKGASEAQYVVGDTITLWQAEADRTLYAVWKALVTYTVYFDCSPCTMDPISVQSSTGSATLRLPETTLEYDFDTLSTDSVYVTREAYHIKILSEWTYLGQEYKEGGEITVTETSVTLQAVWYEKYHIGYGYDGSNNSEQQWSSQPTWTVPVRGPYKEGYKWLGWATTPDATEAEYQPGDTVYQKSRYLSLYSVYAKLNAFTLSFSANGGSGAPTSFTTYSESDSCTVTIPTDLPTNGSLRFLGWSESATGEATVQRGESYTMTKTAATLYAVWSEPEPTQFVLSFDADGGSGAPDDMSGFATTATYSMRIPSDVVPFKNGYTFAGWSIRNGSSTADYKAGDTIILTTAQTTLYAVWNEIVTYTLSFDANGGSEAPQAVIGESDTGRCELTVPTGTPIREGFSFLGWGPNPGATVPMYLPGSVIDTTERDTTLYAVWKELDTFTLFFDANGGSGAPDSITGKSGSGRCELTVPTGTPTREGYVFLGWATDPASDVEYTAGSKYVQEESDAVLYAVWKEIPSVDIRISGSTSVLTGTDVSVTVLVSPPDATVIVTGADWLTYEDGKLTGTAPSVIGSHQVVIKASKDGYQDTMRIVTFTVVTPESSWEVSFNANGGEFADSYRYVLDGGKLTEPENPERDGYAFTGWYTQDGQKYDFDTPVTGDLVLVAHWDRNDDGRSPIGFIAAILIGVVAILIVRRFI